MAKALRKNTICPIGATSPSRRTSADMAANSSAEISLKPIALNRFIASPAIPLSYIAVAGAFVSGLPRSGLPPVERPLLLRRAFDRRQRLDIGRHGRAVLRGELRGAAHNLHHRAADAV